MEELISVIIPVWKPHFEQLKICIESIVNQTYKNLEIIISYRNENAFDEKFFRMINEFNDSRIKIILNKKKGFTNALNEAVVYASGKYIARMDADDSCKVDRIEKQMEFKKHHDYDIVGTWGKIIEIKKFFKYQLEYTNTRKILLNIYKNLLLKNDQDIFEKMHLTKKQIKEMIKMGHTIGSHTHSHVSVAANQLSEEDFEKEILNPKKIIEKEFNTRVISMSYPYGEKNDCLSTIELLDKTNAYKLAFTVAPIRNHSKSSPLEIGRYQPTSRDTTDDILNKIKTIVEKGNL